MESPRKFNDCYFYYYSTCTKGDNCVFRHEPSALGCETMCSAWQQGKCLDKRCKLRHMELRKNRKQIPCYWENQPGGCRKIHCPFMHKNPDARTDGIAPSQPAPTGSAGGEAGAGGAEPLQAAPPAPAPVPLLWQQQRQDPRAGLAGGELGAVRLACGAPEHLPPVVLEPGMLGVLGAPSELRRMLAPHEPQPYPLPVDPLVVNFEEESDNESAPSSTPTKHASTDEPSLGARTKAQELLLLERIQAEAAAFYHYDAVPPPPDPSKERKIVRTNHSNKYDRLSLDEISGARNDSEERRSSLDFKVLSLDEIRARKRTEAAITPTPHVKLNLSRKRKLSTQEGVTTAGNKIIKVVRSNSIVYKKLDKNAPAGSSQAKVERKRTESENSRKRTISEQSDVYEVQDDELVDNCYEFKRIKIAETTTQNKPKLIRNRHTSKSIDKYEKVDSEVDSEISKLDNDSDSEVQIVSVEISEKSVDIDLDKIYETDIIDLDSARMGEPVDVVDLSEEADESDVIASDLDIELVKNVPDVVASCHRNVNKLNSSDHNVVSEIDALLDEDL